MLFLNRIKIDPVVMTNKSCILYTRFPALIILKLLRKEESYEQFLTFYPELEEEDILACLENAVFAQKSYHCIPTIISIVLVT